MDNPFDTNRPSDNPYALNPLPGEPVRGVPTPPIDSGPTPDGPIDDDGERPFPLLLAPFAMLFTPGKFFRYFAPRCPVAFVFLLAYIGGLMKYDSRMQIQFSPTHPALGQIFDNWSIYWGVGAAVALFSAALVVAVGGWFYRLRIRWSGVPGADVKLSNAVFITVDTFTYLSGFIAIAFLASQHDTPADYFYNDDFNLIELAPLLFLLWSPVMSYRALRELFNIERVPGLIWFLILPILTRVIGLGLIIIGILLIGSGRFAAPPDLEDTAVYRDDSLWFEYPGNWGLETMDEGATILLSPPQDSYIKLMVYPSVSPPADEIGYSVAGLEDVGATMTFLGEFSEYSGMVGVGEVYEESTLHPIHNYEFTIFVGQIADGWMFEAQQLGFESDLKDLNAGFDLIEQTLEVTPPSP